MLLKSVPASIGYHLGAPHVQFCVGVPHAHLSQNGHGEFEPTTSMVVGRDLSTALYKREDAF